MFYFVNDQFFIIIIGRHAYIVRSVTMYHARLIFVIIRCHDIIYMTTEVAYF